MYGPSWLERVWGGFHIYRTMGLALLFVQASTYLAIRSVVLSEDYGGVLGAMQCYACCPRDFQQ